MPSFFKNNKYLKRFSSLRPSKSQTKTSPPLASTTIGSPNRAPSFWFSWFKMPWRCYSLGVSFRLWLRDYANLQWLAIILIYIQIGCSMVGSVGAMFNGILLANLAVALFALVAIESSSQNLGRTYAALLACMIFLDVLWFIFFSGTIWNIAYDGNYGPFFVFSLRLALSMQIFSFSVRIFSSLLWIQMYRLGLSSVDNVSYHEPFYRRSLLSPSPEDVTSQSFMSDNILGGYVRNASPSLFEDAEDKE